MTTPHHERRILIGLTLLSKLMLVGIISLLLMQCKPKSGKAAPPRPPVISKIDSTRIRLQASASQSGQAAEQAHRAGQATQTDYQNSLKRYDSLSVSLP